MLLCAHLHISLMSYVWIDYMLHALHFWCYKDNSKYFRYGNIVLVRLNYTALKVKHILQSCCFSSSILKIHLVPIMAFYLFLKPKRTKAIINLCHKNLLSNNIGYIECCIIPGSILAHLFLLFNINQERVPKFIFSVQTYTP